MTKHISNDLPIQISYIHTKPSVAGLEYFSPCLPFRGESRDLLHSRVFLCRWAMKDSLFFFKLPFKRDSMPTPIITIVPQFHSPPRYQHLVPKCDRIVVGIKGRKNTCKFSAWDTMESSIISLIESHIDTSHLYKSFSELHTEIDQ